MNRSGALKITAIFLVLVLCISMIGVGLQVNSIGTTTVSGCTENKAPTYTNTLLVPSTGVKAGEPVYDTATVTSFTPGVLTGTVTFYYQYGGVSGT